MALQQVGIEEVGVKVLGDININWGVLGGDYRIGFEGWGESWRKTLCLKKKKKKDLAQNGVVLAKSFKKNFD